MITRVANNRILIFVCEAPHHCSGYPTFCYQHTPYGRITYLRASHTGPIAYRTYHLLTASAIRHCPNLDLDSTGRKTCSRTPYRDVKYQLEAIFRLYPDKSHLILDIAHPVQSLNWDVHHIGSYIILVLISY